MVNQGPSVLACSCMWGGWRLPSDTRISVDMPRSSNTSLSFKYAELVKSKLLFQLASHSNAGSSSADNDDRIVSERVVLVSVHTLNGF